MIHLYYRRGDGLSILRKASNLRGKQIFAHASSSNIKAELLICSTCGRHNFLQKQSRSSSFFARNSDVEERSLPRNAKVHLDFFGEPVTFQGLSSDESRTTSDDSTTKAMAALDGFQLAVISKGLSCVGGGDEAGLEMKPAHAVALSWTQALRFATVWNQPRSADDEQEIQSAPMLAVVAATPLLIQTGMPYVKNLDTLLLQTRAPAPGFPKTQIYELAEVAAEAWDNPNLDPREKMHLQALNYLLRQNYDAALSMYIKLLRKCPGDSLALSFAIDLSHTRGDKHSAFKAASSVASYWHERRGGIIRPAIPGHTMASSLIAIGMAAGGRVETAEHMSVQAMKQGKSVCGGLATWAQCLVYDAGGRVAEGISALANGDGIANFEGSGLLFFDSHLGGYGSRFAIDREERGRGQSQGLRLYEVNFERVFNYSGYAEGRPWQQPQQKAPLGWITPPSLVGSGKEKESAKSFVNRFFGGEGDDGSETLDKEKDYEIILKGEDKPSKRVLGWEPLCEDVLTWLPPTPKLLSDATLLLLRFTLNGTISTRNNRWETIRNAWSVVMDMEKKYNKHAPLHILPIAQLAASLMIDPSVVGSGEVGNGRLGKGLYKMGRLLRLGKIDDKNDPEDFAVRELIADREPDFWLPVEADTAAEWKEVVEHLTCGLDGCDLFEADSDFSAQSDPSFRLLSWDFESRPILEHAVVYACCKSGDIESLCTARSICSAGVTLRPNSPEEWWRYSIVLGLLGDVVASEDALNTSINVGGGQGSRG